MNEGDFVEINFVARSKDNELLDTNIASEAKKAGLFNEKLSYKPLLVVVGKGMVIKGVDKELLSSEEGVEKTLLIPKEEAFGERREELVRLIPLSRFKESNLIPYPGMVLDVDGTRARVQAVSGGRVRVDFNHEFAGMDLNYYFKVLKKYTTTQEKVSAAAKNFLGIEKTDFFDGIARVHASESVSKERSFFEGKARFLGFVFAYVPEVKKIEFVETYSREKEEKN